MHGTEFIEKCHQVSSENSRRLSNTFEKCKSYVNEVIRKSYPECEIVYTKWQNELLKNRFFVWLGTGYGHRGFTLKECGLRDLHLLAYPTHD